MVEIERKFLVTSNAFKAEATSKTRIVQGFLSTDPSRTVRIRIKGEKGFITIKGKSDAEGLSRFEWEKEIAISEAEALLQLCLPGAIDKFRYEIPLGNVIFEVDEFFAANEGLIVAEVELQSTNQTFQTPSWLGKEVTGENKYYNSQLSINPYKNW